MNTEHTNQSSQAEPVNQQLLALVKSFGHKTGCAKNAFGEQCTCGVDEAIAAAEQSKQAEPVAWIWKFPDGEFYEVPHRTKEECERDCCGYDGMAQPLYDNQPAGGATDAVVAMLEEAEDVLRRVGCDMTAANIRKVLQAQQAEPRCACGDSFTSDAVCANCLAAQPPAVADLQAKLEEAEHHRDCLARAIRNAAVKAGIINADTTGEGPQLLMLADNLGEAAMLSAAPQAVATGWIDPNDKTQKQYLPHIGEPVLFCCDGVTYYGIHTGGSFKTGQGVTGRMFGTWDCLWMYPPTAAAQKGGA